MDDMTASGWVFNIQRFSLHDGPGIRTTVFLKGCPLRCKWCHNPEGFTQKPQIRLVRSLCRLCGRCMTVCPRAVHAFPPCGDDGLRSTHQILPDGCTACGACVEICPTGALEVVGSLMTTNEVMSVVKRDTPFYGNSEGGMTISGGEPLSQPDFTRHLFEEAKNIGIHTAIETSGYADWTTLNSLLPIVDLWFVDLKHTDEGRHTALTGVSNRLIMDNIRRLAATERPLVLRIPWVPGENAEDSFLEGLASFLSSLINTPSVELMPYHNLGSDKREGLGMKSTMNDSRPAATASDAIEWARSLIDAGFKVTVS